jgi:uncharacterized protein (DUF305 family)
VPSTSTTHHRRSRIAPVLLTSAAVAALALAGCGSGGDHAGHGGGASTATTTSRADVDAAFVAQMVPHHEMAVEMAELVPRRSERAALRTLARQVIATQEAEIVRLRTIAERLGVRLPAGDGGHDAHAAHGGGALERDAATLRLSVDEMGMSMDMPALERSTRFDRDFIDAMIPHHQGAIRMARAVLVAGADPETRELAKAIVEEQAQEIAEMNAWRRAWFGAASPAGGVPGAG